MSFAGSLDFQARWEGWLRRRFHSPQEIARGFGVTDQTARNWLDGLTEPRGRHVAHALVRWPDARRALLGDG